MKLIYWLIDVLFVPRVSRSTLEFYLKRQAREQGYRE